MIIVRITRVDDGREWYELRETEDDYLALVNSVYENHPTGYVIDGIELQRNAP